MQQSPFDRERHDRHDDGQTTTKRGPEFAAALAQARGGVRDTDVMGKPPAHVAEAKAKPAPPRPQRKSSPDLRDNPDTIIRSNSAFPLPKRKTARKPPANPDDTLKVDPEASPVDDPTQLMAQRAPTPRH